MNCSAIVLAAGSGKRMGTAVKKQYLEIKGMPVLAYSLRRFDRQPFIREIILVTSSEEIDSCQTGDFRKVSGADHCRAE